MRVLIDGREASPEQASISVFDWAVQRGFGCFEVIRAYRGSPFRLAEHLSRLRRSADILGLSVPDRGRLTAWVETIGAAGGDCQIRVMVTGGGRDPLADAPSRIVVLWEPLPDIPTPLRMLPITAPWHAATDDNPFYGVKWLSYAPNMATTDLARRSGFDEALLLAPDGTVLEGPTFCIAWVVAGRVETPALTLGVLPSITRAVLLEGAARLGREVDEGVFPIDRLLEADEVIGLSTVKEVAPVGVVGDREFSAGPVGSDLAAVFRAIVGEETR